MNDRQAERLINELKKIRKELEKLNNSKEVNE